jgi:hypothetical protein
MQDAIHGFLNKSKASIYGFTYDPLIDKPVSMKRTRLMVTNWKDSEFGSRVTNRVLPLMHEAEDKLGMSRTILEKCLKVPPRYSKSGAWVFNSDIRWSIAPPMISMMTLLIRVGLVRESDDSLETTLTKIKDEKIDGYYSTENQQDQYQVKRAEKGIKTILSMGDRNIFYKNIKKNYPAFNDHTDYKKRINIYTFHDRAGIGSFSDGSTKHVFPYWHRHEGKKK